jgi:predicted nucleic acid-binding protein
MRVVIVDTDVASFIFKGDTRGALYDPHIDVTNTLPAISFMTRAELEQWAVMYNWGQTKRDQLRAFIEGGFITVDSNEALCRMWAEVRGLAQRAGRQIDVADAWIAATAMLYNAELVTHNAGHFDFLPGLQIVTET